MKHVLLLIAAAMVFASCKNENKSTENKTRDYNSIRKEYSYPNDLIGKGKTFVYKVAGKKDEDILEDINLISEAEKQYVIRKHYTSSMNYDSLKYDMQGKLVETYTFVLSDISDNMKLPKPPIIQNFHLQNYFPVKGEIILDTLIDVDEKLEKHISEIVYAKNDSSIRYKDEVAYLKDTVITWQGKQYPCIVTTAKRVNEFANKAYTMHYRNISGDYYYAKGVGLVRYTNKWDNGLVQTVELVEIKDYKLPTAAGYGVGQH